MSSNEEISFEEFEKRKEDEKIVKNEFWNKLKKFTGMIPFTKDAVSMYYCAIDSKTPLYAKAIAFGALAYFVSPMDAIPDFIPIAGLTDDAGVIAAALIAIGKNVSDEHKDQSEKFFNGEK
jgi:uncharacterized membrane protein YkvA (DUF1232 family)